MEEGGINLRKCHSSALSPLILHQSSHMGLGIPSGVEDPDRMVQKIYIPFKLYSVNHTL